MRIFPRGKKSKIILLMLFCVSGCFRSAPPLEEDEVAIENTSPVETIVTPTATPTAISSKVSTGSTGTGSAATPTPTPTTAPTPQRPNNLPLIMQIADQTANEDSQIDPISFRIFDFDDVVKCQDVVPSSSDTNAVDILSTAVASGGSRNYGNVTITGGETTECGISIKTKYARSTPATITLTLKDPSVAAQESKSNFKVQVNSTNTKPYVSASGASSVSVQEDASTPVSIQLPTFEDDTKRVNHSLSYRIDGSPTLGTLTWPNNFPTSPGSATYLPSKDKNGTDSFTYVVCDNDPGIAKCTDAQTVIITVTPENDAPTMSAISDQTTSEATSKYIEFGVGDIDGPLECKSPNLSYSVITDPGDTADLVEATGAVVWGGTWPVCSATVTPKTLKSGTTHIKFSLNDGNPLSTAERTFKLTVIGSNHAPTIKTAIGNQSVVEDSTVSVNFEVEDIDKVIANDPSYTCTTDRLSYSSGNTALVASTGRVTWSGTWPNCTGTIAPTLNANGTVNMTFTVSDPGGLSASKVFQLTITAQNDPPTGTVVCDSNSTTDIVKAGRTGNWTLSCTGASDVDGETLTYTLVRDAGSPFGNSAGFSCPASYTGATLSQAFSTSEYGTCKYKARACDAANTCTNDTAKFIEITSYQLSMSSLSKPALSSSCVVSSTANFTISPNIASINYTTTTGLSGISSSTGTKNFSSTTDSVNFSASINSTYQIASPPTKDTSATATTASFTVTSGTFVLGTQGGSGTGNTISNSITSAYSVERKLEKLAVKTLGNFTITGISLDGYQSEYATTNSVCRHCTSTSYASISAGSLHTCVVDNAVSKCWGKNSGQLGLASSNSSNTYTIPTTTSTSSSTNTTSGFTPLQMASGKDFTCALGRNSSNAEEIRCVGSNSSGQLGLSASQTAFTNKVTLTGQTPIGVAASKTGSHACAITNQTSPSVSGKVFCWGLNDYGQLGTGNTTSSGSSGTVYEVSQGAFTDQNSNVSSIAVGKSHTCAVQYQTSSSTSQVFCWGRNSSGQLGTGNAIDADRPVSLNLNEDVVQLTAGENHTCALTRAGEILCWGDNSVGQLGLGSVTSQPSPVKISSSQKFVQVSAGANHTCALNEDSGVYCWGLGTSGQLGVGKVTTTDQAAGEDCNSLTGVANITFCKQTPSPIDPAPTTTPVNLTAGENHTCIMTIEGNVYCWGANTDGQLGTANKSQVSSPAAVCGSSSSNNCTGQFTTPRPRMCSRYNIP